MSEDHNPTHITILTELRAKDARDEERWRQTQTRLSNLEQRQDKLREDFSQLTGAKKALLMLAGAIGVVAGLIIAAWKQVF